MLSVVLFYLACLRRSCSQLPIPVTSLAPELETHQIASTTSATDLEFSASVIHCYYAAIVA